VLAIILLGAGALLLNGALHQLLHPDAAGDNHFCLVCSMVKGQVSLALEPAASAEPPGQCLCAIPPLRTPPPPVRDHRFAPSRAPPCVLSSPAVVG